MKEKEEKESKKKEVKTGPLPIGSSWYIRVAALEAAATK